MRVEDDESAAAGATSSGRATTTHPADDTRFRLDTAVASLYADLRLTPTLHRLLGQSRLLVGGVAGSVSVVDTDAGSYSKLAERGVTCRLGQRFSLAEGATGRAFARRRPVVIDDYSSLRSGHLPHEHAASRGSVAAVPIWWRGDVVAVNVTFAGRRRRFTAAEIDRLEVLSQSAAGALVTAGADEPALRRWTADPDPADGLAGVEPPAGSPLTAREAEVLALVARGWGDRQIAGSLVVSPKTVEKHVGAALRKTGTTSRTGAAVRALAEGWI